MATQARIRPANLRLRFTRTRCNISTANGELTHPQPEGNGLRTHSSTSTHSPLWKERLERWLKEISSSKSSLVFQSSCTTPKKQKRAIPNGLQRMFNVHSFHFLSPAKNATLLLSISKSASEELFIPYHFHPYSDEYMTIVLGSMDIILSGKKYTLTPESGEFHIPKGQRHSLYSAKGIETHFRERADPGAEPHNQFFSDMFYNGVVRLVLLSL